MLSRICLAAFFCATVLSAAPPPRPYDVDNYDVKLEPDIPAKHLSGEETIEYHTIVDGLQTLELDAGDLKIISVSEDFANQRYKRQGPLLIVTLEKPARVGEQRKLNIRYEAGPGKGFPFFPDQVYTAYFTTSWMAVNFRAEDRASIHLSITAPSGMKVVASGRFLRSHRDGSRTVSEWKQEAPVPPFVFGFAVGDFTESSAEVDKVKLRYLGPPDMKDLKKVFEATAPAIKFMEEKSGIPYPWKTYTEVLAHASPDQELAGFTLLSEKYGRDLLVHPENLWLLAHELAHQWYGIGIACQDFSDFWLNEGLATFLADAFLEQRFGPERYQQEIDKSRKIYEKFKSEGKDRPLSFHDWTTENQVGGSIPYHKGAWVLHLLRKEIGDEAFWRGLRYYSKNNWGKAVTSRDLQKSMESSSEKDLSAFFATWVYH